MKVFTVTYYTNNYGSALQAYALQSKIRELGGQAVIVAPEAKQTGKTPIEKLRFYFRKEKHYGLFLKIRRSVQKRLYAKRTKKINTFIRTNAEIVPYRDALEPMQSDECVLMAGSDQIWSTLNHPIDGFYLFNGISNPRAKKVSYAASIGISEISEEQKKYYRSVLSPFDVVSFRESHALELLKPVLSNEEVRQDVDPTLLFDGSFWARLASRDRPEKPYLFVYMLRPDSRMIEIARRLARAKGLEIVYIGLYSNRYPKVRTVTDAGVEDFLSYLYHADTVVTNSFHGTVFSLLFHKSFVSLKLDATSSRAENLLKIAGLEDHLITGVEESDIAFGSYDWPAIDGRLENQRQRSISYLRSVICP